MPRSGSPTTVQASTRPTVDQMFEPFFTTKGPRPRHRAGACRGACIVNAHEGAYLVRSRAGAGSEFSIFLPLAREAARTAAGDPLRGEESVLIVDDEVDLTDMLSIGLERLGYDVTCCNDPTEALSAFEEDPECLGRGGQRPGDAEHEGPRADRGA